MNTDEIIQKNVMIVLKYNSLLKFCEISVTAKEGVVTLSGNVDTYEKIIVAEYIAKNVLGVKTLIQNMDVYISNMGKERRTEIAETFFG